MKNSKKIYFGLLLVIVFLISTMYFSYAFFTSINEEHGKLNIVAGTLDYKIESKDLENNQITIKANEIEKVELSITSLNEISSKYELYYNAENDNDIEIGYSINSIDKVSGEVEANSKKNITVIIKNNSSIDKVITLGVQGGFINNQLELTKGKSLNNEINLCNYEAGKTITFDYTGDSQLFTTLCEGNYQVELWGASGGDHNDNPGGQGGYTKGTIYLDQAENLYLYVGSKPTSYNGGYNGGASGGNSIDGAYTGGGGATDIRLTSGQWSDFDSLKSRIMVASGGAGTGYYYYKVITGGASGGLEGYVGELSSCSDEKYELYGHTVATAGTQISGGLGITVNSVVKSANSGKFGYAYYKEDGMGTGGGSGYYGGGSGRSTNCNVSSGAGGSSFISGHNGCDAIEEESTETNIIHTGQSVHYSNHSFYDTVMIDGEGYNWTNEKGNVVVGMPTHDGTSTMIGNSGNGYAKITYLGKTNTKYDTYKIGDEVTLKDSSKWHVLEYSGYDNQYVTLLSDYNLNSDGTYNDKCGRDINSTYKCSTIAFDPDDTGSYDETDNNNIGYFIKNTYQPLVTNALPGTTYVSLPTADQIAKVDGLIYTTFPTLTSSWLLTTNYWTKTAHATNASTVWRVGGENSTLTNYYALTSNSCGTRPVITTLKSNIVKTISSSTVLSIGTPVEAVDGSKWHVLENSDSNSKYVTLLSDYNLNDDGTYNTECRKDISDTGICSNRVFSVGAQGVYDETNVDNIGYFIKNTYAPLVLMLETTNITLPTAEQILKADSKQFTQFPDVSDENAITLKSSWLTNLSYWTKTISDVNNKYVYVVLSSNKFFLRYYSSNSYGARPVITTLKTNLLQK